MKRFLIVVTAVMIAACLVAGCAEVNIYTDSGQTISICVNQEFVIALGSNRTTGYMWQESYDGTMVELVKIEYRLSEEAKQGLIGAGGVELFRFKALETGETEITLVYARSGEEEGIDQKVFTVNIE